jgi:hypothetical protein
MIIRQEESTPIGNYFHDNGILKLFDRIQKMVDEFEIDTDRLNSYCDLLVTSLKGAKTQIKKVETAWTKHKAQEELSDSVNIGFE